MLSRAALLNIVPPRIGSILCTKTISGVLQRPRMEARDRGRLIPFETYPVLSPMQKTTLATHAPHQGLSPAYPFHVGSDYTRNDIFAVVGLPEHSGGPWYTGYTSRGPDWFIFCNVGISGRTGHDYENYFIGDDLVWSAKTNTHLRQPVIQQLLNPTGKVYLFYREGQRDPFTFAGSAHPVEVFDTAPVKVRWRFRTLDGRRQEYLLPEEVDDEDAAGLEGERRLVLVNIYERNPAARKKCISHWHPICQICEFDFEAAMELSVRALSMCITSSR